MTVASHTVSASSTAYSPHNAESNDEQYHGEAFKIGH
jgi:hypothetical protein